MSNVHESLAYVYSTLEPDQQRYIRLMLFELYRTPLHEHIAQAKGLVFPRDHTIVMQEAQVFYDTGRDAIGILRYAIE